MDKILGRKPTPELKPPDCLSRYVVTKHAWYKKYKRIFCITPTAIHTQNPERTLVLTNSYPFVGDSDIESVTLGADEFEFIISARQDKKGKFKPLKFTCKHRQLLLTDLLQCMAAASAMARCLVASKVLGPQQDFQAVKWSRTSNGWKPVTLRVAAFGLESLESQSGVVKWRCDYQRMSSPGIMLLAPYVPPPAGHADTATAVAAAATPQEGVFAVMTKLGRSTPRVFAARARDTLVGQVQQVARKKLAINIMVDSSAASTLHQLLEAVMLAERSSSSEASELPLGQWEVEAMRGRADLLPPQLLMASPAQSAHKLTVEALAGMTDMLVMSGGNTVPRRLVVTPTSLITRRVDSHEVVMRRPLTAIAAVVRFADDPKLLAIEWEDGAAPSQFVTPARDAVLATVLAAAQAAAARPIAVMPGFSSPGDVIITDHKHASHAPASEPEPELTRMYLAELNSRGKELAPVLQGSSMMFYQSHISFNSSPRATRSFNAPAPITVFASSPNNSSTGSTTLSSAAVASPAAASLSAAAAKLGTPGSSPAAAGYRATAGGDHLTPQDAANVLLECVYEFNACVPYSGVSLVAGEGCELEPQAVAAVLALLPEDLQPGMIAPALAPDDVKQAVAVLHCLQRLASHPHMAEQLLSASTALSRVWACLACGSDHVVAEGARLLVRLFAPAPARHGAAAWRLLRTASPLGAEDFYLTNSREDTALARNAKLLAFPPVLQAERLSVLLQPLARPNPASHLTSMALLEVIAAVAVDPGARTSDSSLQDACLRAAAALGRPLFTLFSHPAARVADGAAVLMRAIAECGSTAAAPMRDAALREGAVLHHLQLALFAAGDKAKLSQELIASWADEHPPALALLRSVFPPGLVRYLNAPKALTTKAPPRASVAVAANAADTAQPGSATAQPAPVQGSTARSEALTGPPAAGGPLVATSAAAAQVPTAVPASSAAVEGTTALTAPGLSGQVPAVSSIATAPQQQTVLANGNMQHATSSPAQGAASEQAQQQQQQQQQAPQTSQKPPRLPEVSGGLRGNWPAFWSAVSRDHCHAGLIWNESTRRELRDALDRELAGLRAARTRVAKGGGGWPTWNWSEFSVSYPSTANQLCIGGVYIRLLLEGGDSAAIDKLASPKEFFTACYHTLLCCPDVADTATARTSSNSNSNVAALSSRGSAVPESKTTQELCIKAMAAAYSAHAGVIGPFEGIPHVLQLLDDTTQRSLRHGLLLFLQALIAPKAAGDLLRESYSTASSLPKVSAGALTVPNSVQDFQQQQPLVQAGDIRNPKSNSTIADGSQAAQALTKLTPSQAAAVRAAKANGYLLMDHGGLQLLVDFVAGAHECTERRMAAAAAGAAAGAAAAGAGHFITSISHAEAPKEWYFYPKGQNYETQNATSAVTKLDAGTAAKGSDDRTAANLSYGHVDGSQSQPQQYQVGEETVSGPDETGRAGPLSKEALKQLFLKSVITYGTWVWAAGMPESQQLREVRELRWMLASGLGLLGPFEAALVALQILQQLANLQPAVDEYGSVLQPLPRAHRGLADPSCLPHIAQVILTGEPALVSAAASLLACILVHNSAALSRLYLTGVFLFGLAYCGSNLTELAALFKTAHLVQAFRGPAEVTAGLPLVQRSYLGAILPESLLHMLETYGPGVFAAALSGDHDTPEVIWTAGMRQSRLIPAMLQHLGDFAHRLAQHCHAVYEYTPPPPMTWPELADEIWCHRYYLKNLCDEDSFRGWPVVDHIPFLQALMEQWRAELGRQPLAMSETQACETLGIAAGAGGLVSEDDMRKAYRALARRYHPDKNPSPEARAKFLQIQKAYERLQAGAAGGQGPQAWRLLLMLRAQCILFRRYPAVLAPFKYAGYSQLLEVLRIVTQQSGSSDAAAGPREHANDSPAPASNTKAGQPGAAVTARSTAAVAGAQHFLSGDAVEQVLAAIELCWLTCVASKRNAEELMRSGGLPLLAGLLSRCVGILSLDVAPTAAPAVITTHALRTLAGLAAVAAARKEMEQHTQLLADISKCCALNRAPAAVDAALVAICHLSASSHLQHMLLEVGALPYLVPLLLEYDVTLSPETSVGLQLPFTATGAAVAADDDRLFEASFRMLDSALVRPNMQEARSQHALLAAQALGRLAGVLSEPYQTPSNSAATSALSALLTQSLAARLSESDPRPLLICLNSSLETAQVIWNSSMREELSKALDAQRSSGADLATLQSFTFTSLAGELQVGGVFVRVFNQRGRSGASASNATVTAATAATGATAAAGAAVAAAAAPGGPLSSGSRAAAAPAAAGTAVAPSAAAAAQPQDPAAFCKALVRYLYERLVERCYRGSELHMLSKSEAVNVLEVLQALDNLLEAEPRLLGLLSSKSALSPMVACITPAASSYPPLFEQAASAVAGKQRMSEGTPTILEANSQGITGDSSNSEPAADAAQIADTAEQLAALGLQLMSRGIANAAVQEALVDESLLRQLYWLVVQPPSSRVLVGALGLLRRLTGSALAALVAGYQGGAVLLLSVLLHTGSWSWPGADAAAAAAEGTPARASAADVLSQLMGQPTHGPRVRMILGKLLPPGLVAAVVEGPPEAVLRALGQNMENPECMWDSRMAAQASAEVSQVAAVIRKQHAGHSYDWSPAPNYQLEYDNLRGEIYVGGVYVRLFLKNPKYAVRDPVKFAEALVERYLQELMPAAANADGSTVALDRCLLLSAAAVVLLQGHGLLADHIAQLGYSGRLLSVLASRTARIPAANAAAGQQHHGQQQQRHQQQVIAAPDELGGSILRLLHQLAAAHGASEALASATGAPLVPTLVSAMAWGHGACILVLETLKRALDMGNRQRDTLVAQALQVGLLEKLLGMLDWRSSSSDRDSEQPVSEARVDSSPPKSQAQEQEQALERALAVDVLRLLAEEGSYSGQVSALLARSSIWAAYRDQRHDMFLPSGATAESGVVGLLTAGDTARYALPAPESVQGQVHPA